MKSNSANPADLKFEILDSLVVANRMINLDLAGSYAKQAYSVSAHKGIMKNIIRSLYLLSLTTKPTDKDSTFLILNRALSLSIQYKTETETANILYSLALLYQSAGDIKTAMACLDSAMTVAQKNEQISNIGRIYNLLGNIYIELNDSVSSKKMYQNAYLLGHKYNDNLVMGIALGNLAQFQTSQVIKSNELQKAIHLLKKKSGNEEELAQVSVNVGLATTDPYTALKWFAEALSSGRKAKMAESQLGALNNMVYCLLDLNKSDSAESCIVNYAIPLAKKMEIHGWLSTLYDTYADILIHTGEFQKAAVNLKKSMNEKLLEENQKANIQVRLLAAIMDTKNKEEAIEKNALELERNKIIVKEQFMGGIVLIFVFTLIILLLIARNQRRKIKLKNKEITLTKKIIDIEENQTKILGRELHDAISSLMQRLAGYFKNSKGQNSINHDQPGFKLEELLVNIRSISHRMNKLDFSESNLQEILIELSYDMKNLTGINLTMDVPDELPLIPESMTRNIYRIVQELLTNAGKYAGEAPVFISIGAIKGRIVLVYKDKGPGFNQNIKNNQGIGLSGIRDRVEIFGGTAQLETSPGNGLSWFISLPIPPVQSKNS